MRDARSLPEDEPLVALRRGPLVESVHRGRVAVCDPAGVVLEAVGDPEGYAYVRSSAKPFQALPLVLSGAADAFGLTDEELAIACASHSGEERHLAAVRSLLAKAGLSEERLQSGPHYPRDTSTANGLVREGEKPRPIHGNCSGKHAGMLAVCAHEDWSLHDYRDPGHPLQRTILELVAEACGIGIDEILLGGDGCGAPAFAMPLGSLATGFARLATGEQLSGQIAGGCRRVREAMRADPHLVAGKNRFDTRLMEATALVAKGGAEGVFACGSPEGWGMAIKVSDGAGRAVRPAALAALAQRGVTPSGDLEPVKAVRDLRGEAVGEIEPVSGPGLSRE